MDFVPSLAQIVVVIAACLMLAAALSDLRSLTIPNRYSVALVLLYPAYVFAAPYAVDWYGGALVAAIALAAGFVLFSLRLTGGGDAKLFAAVAIWAGPQLIVPLIFYTTMAGAVMAVFMYLRYRLSRAASISDFLFTAGDEGLSRVALPYGVAIATGGLYVAFTILGVR